MANEFDARFVVQRDDKQFTCRGKDLYAKVKDTDIFAIQRGDTLYHGTKDKIRDSDWLVCIHKNISQRVEGSQVIPLLLPPPPLEPLVVKINGEEFDTETTAEFSAGTEISIEVITNSEANNLTKEYYWTDRTNAGNFNSSAYARAVNYIVGKEQSFAVVTCTITSPGAEAPSVTTPPIQIASI